MKKKAPPIKIWIWVGFLFISLQLIILAIYTIIHDEGKHKIFNNQITTIEKKFNKKPELYNIIVIGSSLTDCGVEEAIYSDSIQLTKIVAPGDYFYSFINTHHLIDHLLNLKPDLVCIQTELAAITFNKNKNFTAIEKLSSKNGYIFKHFLRTYQRAFSTKKSAKFDSLTHTPPDRWVKKVENLDFAFNALKKLNLAGIKTKIIDIPRPFKTEQKMYTREFKSDLNSLLKIYKRKLDIEHLNYTGETLFYKHFSDGGHLNETGKIMYTKWFLNILKKEINN